MIRSHESENDPCGHALMASCPPSVEPDDESPFGTTNVNHHGSNGQKTWDLSKPDLANLLDLSKRLNLDGEITPVMAWGMILGHQSFAKLTSADFTMLSDELGAKVRCYGYVPVLFVMSALLGVC